MADDVDMGDDDAEALRVRRADLYAFMEELTAAAAMLPAPETYLEAERAVRAISMADRMAQMLRDETEEATEDKQETPPPPKKAVPLPIKDGAEKKACDPIRKALRLLADRMMKAAKTIPLPCDAMTALRALRYTKACDRMLTQLYTVPKPKLAYLKSKKPEPAPPIPPHLRLDVVYRELWEKFSPSPEAQAIRAARQKAAQSEAETDTKVDGSAEETKTPIDETKATKPRPNISEEQADKANDQTTDPP